MIERTDLHRELRFEADMMLTGDNIESENDGIHESTVLFWTDDDDSHTMSRYTFRVRRTSEHELRATAAHTPDNREGFHATLQTEVLPLSADKEELIEAADRLANAVRAHTDAHFVAKVMASDLNRTDVYEAEHIDHGSLRVKAFGSTFNVATGLDLENDRTTARVVSRNGLTTGADTHERHFEDSHRDEITKEVARDMHDLAVVKNL